MREALQGIFQFFLAITRYLSAYITGGIIIAGITIYEHLAGKSISAKVFWRGIGGYFVVATFRSWRDQYRVAMQAKKTSSQKRPEVIFDFDPSKFNIHGKQEFFSLANRGTADAFHVKIEDMVNGTHTAVWETVPTILQKKSVPASFDIFVDGVPHHILGDNAGVFLEATWKTTTGLKGHILRMPVFVRYEDIDNNQFKTGFELTYECISKDLEITFKKLHMLS